MYAILAHGGRQYRVSAGDRLVVDRLDAEVGSVIELSPVLLTGGDGKTNVGDAVDGVRVAATVVAHSRGPKLRIFKYKAKKRYRRAAGHRSDLTEVHVESIVAKGEAMPSASVAGRPARARTSAARTRAGAGRATASRAAAKRAGAARSDTKPTAAATRAQTAEPKTKTGAAPAKGASATKTAARPASRAKTATKPAAPAKAAAKPASKPRAAKPPATKAAAPRRKANSKEPSDGA